MPGADGMKALADMLRPHLAPNLSEGRLKAMVDDAVARFTPKVSEVVLVTPEGERRELGKVHKLTDKALRIVALQPFTKRGLFLVGPAGSFKTTAAGTIAAALNLPYYPIAVGPQTSKADLVGFVDAHGKPVWTVLRKAHTDGGLVLLDEIDAGNAGVLTIANSLFANEAYTWPDGTTTAKHADFRFMAAGNTYGMGANLQYVGRNALDAATLDRFTMMEWSYDEELEKELAIGAAEAVKADTKAVAVKWVARVVALRRAAEAAGVRVVFSPRASMSGAALLAAGFEWNEVETLELWGSGKIKQDDRERILARV
jgi:cobaltochelatase CobS